MWKCDWDKRFAQQDIDFVGTRMLLRQSIRPPKKSEKDWARLGNDLLLRFATEKNPKKWLPAVPPWLPFLAVPAFRPALLAGVLVALTGIPALFVFHASRDARRQPSIVRVQGTANFLSGNAPSQETGAPVTLGSDMRLPSGVVVETSPRGSLVIRVDSATGLELGENTRVQLVKSTTKSFVLAVERGSLLAHVGKRGKNQEFRILTPNSQCRVVGTTFRVEVHPCSAVTRLTVAEGVVEFSHRTRRDYRMQVGEGRSASLVGTALSEKAAAAVEEIEKRTGVLRSFVRKPMVSQEKSAVLDVSSRPSGAEVFINGVHAGVTPLAIQVPAGSMRVTVTHLSSAPYDTFCTVSNGQNRVHAELLRRERTAAGKDTIAPLPRSSAPVRPARSRLRMKPQPPAVVQVPVPLIRRSREFAAANSLVEAGDYAAAMPILDTLSQRRDLVTADRITVLEKRALCSKKTRGLRSTVSILEELYLIEENRIRRENLLWEIVTIKSSESRDYESVEMDLIEYLIAFPDGIWTFDAYELLAEAQFILGKFEIAARTYEKLVRGFPNAPDLDRSLYALAQIHSQNLDDCHGGLRWYTRMLRDYPRSEYRENALFWKAECLVRTGRVREAQEQFGKYLAEYPNGLWKRAATDRLGSARIDRQSAAR